MQYKKTNSNIRSKDPFTLLSGKHKEGSLISSYRSKWSEDAFVSDSRPQETMGHNFNFKYINLIVVILFISLSLLLAKTAYLQIYKGDYYSGMSEGNRIRISRIEPRRGVIYDQKLRPLVRNKPNFMLYLTPADLPEEDDLNKIFERLSEILGQESLVAMQEKLEKIDKNSLEAFRPLFIEDNIDYEKAMSLYLEVDSWSGITISNRSNREYLIYGLPSTEQEKYYLSMSHIMGYTGKINQNELDKFGDEYLAIDYIGKMGIEYFWENELKGQSGKKQIEVDALGKEKKILGQVEPQDGHNLVLSLDVEQQLKMEEILTKTLEKLGLTRASAVVLDPSNGEVLAMVSLPAYNNNVFARGISHEEYNILINHQDHPLFNRAVSGEYPSGSTVKPVMAAAALEEGIISENTSFLSTGGLRIGEWFFPDWKAGGHGRTNVRKAIAQSVNTFFYYIGGGYDDFRGLGVDRIVKYGELFGLGSQLGIDLAGEADGFLPTREWKKEDRGERWYVGDTYHLAIGQGDLLVTPLQVAAYTSVLANGGALYRLHFIRQILSSDDQVIREIQNDPIRKDFIDPYNMHVVREGMRQTVTLGSARSLNSVPVPVAGKTGTAQWSSVKDTHAWFVGFAPYENPELAFAILVEEGGEGSSVAVPIAKEFLEWYFGEYKKNE